VVTGSFTNVSQPAGTNVTLGSTGVTLGTASAFTATPAPIEPSYNYTVVATQISSEPVENILVPVLGGETTTTSGDTTLEKKPPACS